MQYTLLIIDLVLWGVVVFVKAAQFRRHSLSVKELERRAKSGDHDAAYEFWRHGLLPKMGGLKWLVETLLIFISITILFQVLKPIAAILLSLAMLLATDAVSRQKWMVRLADSWLIKREAGLLKWADTAAWLRWFMRPEMSRPVQVGSREELAGIISRVPPNILSRDERNLLLSQLEFGTLTVSDIMTPRSMIDSVELNETIGPLLLDRLHRSGHSRFPVISDDIDHVVGMLYLQELIGGKTAPDTVKKAMKPEVFYIGERRDLEHALHAFLRSHHHLFIVVNEFRETVGILSLEDVIEAMIGRSIVDEFDAFDDLRTVAASNPKANNAPKGKQDI